jgi:hypothetical protein
MGAAGHGFEPGHHDFQSVYVCAALCHRFLKNCSNKRYLCTFWSVLVCRVLPNIVYIVVNPVVNVRPSDQIQLAVPKLESQGVCPRTRSSSRQIGAGSETRICPSETRHCLVACLLVLPARPHTSYGPLFSPSFLRHGQAPERVDHDVVGDVCLLLYSVLVMQCFHAGSCPPLRQARPTFYRLH